MFVSPERVFLEEACLPEPGERGGYPSGFRPLSADREP